MRGLLIALVGMFVALDARAAEPLAYPETSRSIDVAPNMRMNGQSVQLHQFVVDQPIEDVLSFYRQQFGARHVEPTLDGYRVISTMRNGVFTTVRLNAVDPRRTIGMVLETPQPKQDRTAPDALRNTLATDSRVSSDLEFQDEGRQSRLLVFDNQQSRETNVDRVRDLMQQRSMTEQRDKTVLDADGNASRTIWYGGPGGEAIAVFSDKGERRMVVLNLTSTLERK